MKYFDVFVQRDNGVYRASVPALPNISAEGVSREDAVGNVKQIAQAFLSKVEVTTIQLDAPSRKEARIESAGLFAGDKEAMLKHIEDIHAERTRQREALERELEIAEEIASPDRTLRPGSPKAVLRAAADCRIDPDDEMYRRYICEMDAEEQRQREEIDMMIGQSER